MKKLTVRQQRGVRDALLSSALYATGFITIKVALSVWSPMVATFLRLAIASLLGVACLVVVKKASSLSGHWKIALIPGLISAVELLAISIGLAMTSVSDGVFISSTYVVFVPLFVGFKVFSFSGVRHVFFVVLALFGVWSVSEYRTVTLSTAGDLFWLLTSILTAAHVVVIQKVSPNIKSSFAFNLCQCIWASMFVAVGVLFFEDINSISLGSTNVWLGIFSTAIFATLISALLQVRTQMRLGATASSLLLLTDGPFAALLGVLIFAESFSVLQAFGYVVIFSASVGQLYFDHKLSTRIRQPRPHQKRTVPLGKEASGAVEDAEKTPKQKLVANG